MTIDFDYFLERWKAYSDEYRQGICLNEDEVREVYDKIKNKLRCDEDIASNFESYRLGRRHEDEFQKRIDEEVEEKINSIHQEVDSSLREELEHERQNFFRAENLFPGS